MNSLPRSELWGQLWIFADNLLAKGIILQYTTKSEKGLFIL